MHCIVPRHDSSVNIPIQRSHTRQHSHTCDALCQAVYAAALEQDVQLNGLNGIVFLSLPVCTVTHAFISVNMRRSGNAITTSRREVFQTKRKLMLTRSNSEKHAVHVPRAYHCRPIRMTQHRFHLDDFRYFSLSFQNAISPFAHATCFLSILTHSI